MKLNCNSFFDGNFNEIDLNQHFKGGCMFNNSPKNIQNFLNGLSYLTYGGYGEDRKNIWKGTYLDKKKNYIHLGIDINVPAGTKIKCPFNECWIYQSFLDRDKEIGWGGRIVLQPFKSKSNYLLVLGHLNTSSIKDLRGRLWKKNEILGKVGTWPNNGNVFEHLHIQLIKEKNLGTIGNDLFDGYGFKKDLKDNPNPFKVEF